MLLSPWKFYISVQERSYGMCQVLGLMGMAQIKNILTASFGEQQSGNSKGGTNNPTVLIADEPTGNLDPDTAWEIMQLLEQINRRGTTILMVTHAKDIVDRMGKRVIAIDKGKIVRDDRDGSYGYESEEAYSFRCKPGGVFDNNVY